MREIVVDTETTGLNPEAGHRVIEIGCIELVNHVPTGAVFHEYLNPERDVPEEVVRIHGLTGEFLAGKPPFESVADAFLDFVGDSRLVIHNAEFDLGFLNAELARAGRDALRNGVVDTVALARRKYPGAPANLDALCRRFDVDNSERVQHGALLDAELLAEVYLELIGGRQPGLTFGTRAAAAAAGRGAAAAWTPRRHEPTAAEAEAHEAFLDTLPNPIWRR